jgi:flagellar capping protein FliD
VSLDGVTRAIQLSGTSNEEILSNLQETLNKSFGTGVVVQADGTITTLSSRQITFSGTTENLSILGLSASASNRVNLSSQLKDLKLNQSLNNTSFKFKINGVEFNFDETKTVSEVIDTINQSKANVSLSYSNINDRFVLSSKILGQGVDIDVEDLSGNLMGSLFKVSSDEFNRIEGKNAILSVDGQEIERNSNNFEVNQFKLNLVSTNTNKTVLSAKNSTNEVSSTITKFVEEYNSLVDKIYSLTTEKSEYRDYSPLTDAQKEEMSEKEIELWEKKAKTGLVRSDTNLVSLMSELRQSLMSKGDGSLSLNDMGITSGSYSDRGKLSIDPTKLNEALETRMDEVQALFTDVNTGLAQKFNAVLNKNAQTSLSNPGRLVSVAGIANTSSDIKNTMYDRIKSIESSITNLQRMYDSQKDRYWKQFSNLETAMSKLNSQSSWLTQQLG